MNPPPTTPPPPSPSHPRSNADLPPHLVAVRQAAAASLQSNGRRITSQRRRGGEPKVFAVGDAVLVLPQKCGTAGGSTISPRHLVGRVVSAHGTGTHGVRSIKYKVRSNAGLVKGLHFPDRLKMAPPKLAAQLTFAAGQSTAGLPTVKFAGAKARRGGTALRCGCRGKCGRHCACKKAGHCCSRSCGCKGFCKGYLKPRR